MSGKPYTDADVETVGTAIRECGMKDAFFDSSAGSWEVEEKQYQYDGAARVVLDALITAGWQPPGQTAVRCEHPVRPENAEY